MISQIKRTVENAQSTLLQDAVGAAALVVMFVAALYAPSLL